MFIVLKNGNDQLIEAASAEDKSSAEKLIASLSKHWPAEYVIRYSASDNTFPVF